jgi:hypothetical protein
MEAVIVLAPAAVVAVGVLAIDGLLTRRRDRGRGFLP